MGLIPLKEPKARERIPGSRGTQRLNEQYFLLYEGEEQGDQVIR